MKALQFQKTGDIKNLALVEVNVPEPKENEVLVQVKAASINPSDIKNVMGNMKGITTLPRIPGRDFAGIVAKGAIEGQEVFGSARIGFGRDGAQAEYVVVPKDALVEKPKGLSFEVAAALGIPYMTAWSAIIDEGGVEAGNWVLITGINGAVGSVAAQLAKYKGAKVIGAGKAPAKVLVDLFVDLQKGDLASAVMQATGNKGVELSLDTVGGALFAQCVGSLAENGRHMVIATQEPKVTFNLFEFYRRQGQIIGINTLKFENSKSSQILGQVIALISQGHLQPPAPKIIPLEQALDAYQQLYAGTLKGKVVIQFH